MRLLVDNNLSPKVALGALLAASGANKPSLLLVRRIAGRRAEQVVAIILANLEQVADDLAAGSVVVLGEDWIRVRRLPIVGR